jgi:hypothetical protein
MPAVKPPEFPKTLTIASWEKAKGVIARITSVKTGVTEKLSDAIKAYKAAPFDDLNVSPAVLKSTGGLKGLRAVQDDYLRKNHPAFKKLEMVFYDLSETLKKKASDFDKDDKLKKFSPVLRLMAEDANKFTYAVAWGTVSESNQKYLETAINSEIKAEQMWAAAAKKVKAMIDSASSLANSYKSKPPNLAGYTSFWAQQLRGIGAQIQMAGKNEPGFAEKYSVPLSIAKKQWADGSLPKKDADVAEQVKADIVLLKKFKDISDKS